MEDDLIADDQSSATKSGTTRWPHTILLVGWWTGATAAATTNASSFPKDWDVIHFIALSIVVMAASLVADSVLAVRLDPIIDTLAARNPQAAPALIADFAVGLLTTVTGSASLFLVLQGHQISTASLQLSGLCALVIGVAYAGAAWKGRYSAS